MGSFTLLLQPVFGWKTQKSTAVLGTKSSPHPVPSVTWQQMEGACIQDLYS